MRDGFEMEHDGLRRRLHELRTRLDDVFAPDTAAPGTPPRPGKPDGHCAVVAMLLHDYLGGEYVSATFSGLSHWFNRILNEGLWIDVDITGDQFYGSAVRIGEPNTLWEGTRARSAFDLNHDTRKRYALLRSRLP